MAKKSKEKSNEVSLETVLWNCRVALRGVGGTDKNRDAVISLVFIKFASDKFKKRREEIIAEHGENNPFLEKSSFYRSKNVFYLPAETRWDYLVKNAGKSDIAVIIDNALKIIAKENEPLKGALQTNLFSTLGASQNSIKQLIDEISKIDEEKYKEEDLIGRVYEYFLQIYAAAGTKEEGEFYTPSCVVKLIAELIEPYSGTVYDPCCGSGGMFVQSIKFVDNHNGNRTNISILGQESKLDTWRLCKLNLASRSISCNLGEKNDSTFTNDLHKDKKADFIMANPPFNLKNWRKEDELQDDARFKGFAESIPPVSNANYAWILHMLSKLDEQNGIAGFLLANGALNADGIEGEIRKELIERDKVEAIIVLPRDMFYTTDISVTVWIVNNNKKERVLNGRRLRNREKEILFVDLRQWSDNIEEYVIDKNKKKKKTVLTDDQIGEIKDLYNNWQGEDTSKYEDTAEFCRSVHLNEIREKNHSLVPSKYIEFVDRDLDINFEKEMTRIKEEMKEVLKIEKKSQKMLEEAFRGIGYAIDEI